MLANLYHYTTVEALINGIVKENSEHLCLWASNAKYLNDPTERTFGEKLLLKKANINKDHMRLIRISGVLKKLNIYTCSFSEVCDCLPMWSIYGNNGEGISLGFDYKALVLSGYSLIKCIYKGDKGFEERVNSMITDIQNSKLEPKEDDEMFYRYKDVFLAAHRFGLITGNSLCIKDASYSFEKEWRCVLSDTDGEIFPRRYRYGSKLTIPYICIELPKTALKEIWLGPTHNQTLSEESLRLFLNDNGMKEVKIHKSKVPYRNN